MFKTNKLFLALEIAITEDVEIICINSKVQIYHPVKAGFSANYKKQMVIISIKSGMHVSIYVISSAK